MTQFRNEPQMQDENGEGKIRRYIHSPLAIEHYGTNAKILENGKVVISKVVAVKGDEVEFDEIEIPASLIFKLANLLKATRKVVYVSIEQARTMPADSERP